MINLTKQYLKLALARTGYSVRRSSELTHLADRFGSDKGTQISAHLYTRIYEKLFGNMRNKELTILEIGLRRADQDGRRTQCAAEGVGPSMVYSAPSLKMWRAYFPNARIFGFDIDDFSQVRIDRCEIIRGDMSSRSDLARAATAIANSIDIIIEDGSHASHHQQIALGALFPHVRSGGIYVIEDLHWQDSRLEKESAPKTRDLLRRLQVRGIFESPFISSDERKYLEENIGGVQLFDSLTADFANGNDTSDALAVIRKKAG
jgi:hypothetical protein